MFRALPPLAIALGVAGLIPFMFLGIASVGANARNTLAAVQGLIGYGAIILGFLGGVHWGFTLSEAGDLSETGDARAARARLGLGVVPSLVGWAAILCSIIGQQVLALAVLIAGYVGTLIVESRAQKRDLLPGGYIALRWVLSLLVIAILTTVLVLRLVGAHVLL
jgi:hypothetical protein